MPMKHLTARLIDAAAESFPMRGPIYEFGFSSLQVTGPPSPDDDFEAAASGGSARIERLEDLDRLPFADATAGTVICENALPYVFEPHRAIAEMTRILAPGGLLLVVASTLGPTGGDNRYWTPSPSAIGRLLASLDGTLTGWIGPDAAPHTVFGIGCKSPLRVEFARGVQPFLDRLDRALAKAASQRGVLQSLGQWLIEWMGSPLERRGRRDYYRAQYALHLSLDEQSRPVLLESCLPQAKMGTRLDLSE
jgi:SAM-dependent methyltransferase